MRTPPSVLLPSVCGTLGHDVDATTLNGRACRWLQAGIALVRRAD